MMNTETPSVDSLIEKLHRMHDDLGSLAMSPRERVEAAIQRRQPDRTPFDFWAVPEMIEKLKAYFAVDSEEEILRLFGIDCRIVTPDYVGPARETLPDGTYYAHWGTHRRQVKNDFATYDEYASFPLAAFQSVAEIEQYSRWPQITDWDWASLPQKIVSVNKEVQYHIRYDIGGIFETAWGLYGLDKFLMDLIEKPEIPLAIMDCVTDRLIANFRQVMKHAEGMVDLVYTYDDVAIQNSLLMSKKMWRKYILPFHQKLNQAIKEYDMKILYHSCGAVYDLIEEFISDMHIDILNPLQPRAAKMDMRKIKDEFGARVAFHGGIDIQYTMPFGSTAEVAAETRERCAILGQGGGYICTTAHYIQADTPVENVIALYATDRTLN